MSKFNRYFMGSLVTENPSLKQYSKNVVSEQDEEPVELPPDDGVASDEETFGAALDKGTPPDQFDTEPLPVDGGDYLETAKHWCHKLKAFAEELNGLDANSLNVQINDLDKEGSPFQGIEKELSSDIVGVAETLAGMAELIKGHVIGVNKRQREFTKQNSTQQPVG